MYNKKILVMVSIVFVLFFVGVGCKKKSQEPVQVETSQQYEAQAKDEITEDNMEDELQKIEKELDEDISAEQ